jgi:uncharacterized protein YndB with AHSA1/START domain
MSTPDVPLRMELTFEVPGPPEQVWQAIATANGITAWFIPTDMEEREGGAICFHMGEDDSPGTITDFDAPHRLVYEEPGWASLAGHDPTSVTPLVSEFLVEAQSGGTCVLRVVSSAFGTGADWEQEFFDEMEKGWKPYFENLRLYLTDFPGQQVTSMAVYADVPGATDRVWSALRQALGATEVGQAVDGRGLTARVERIGTPPGFDELLLRVTDPVPGFLQFAAFDKGDNVTTVMVYGYLFSDDAPAFVEREQPGWEAWLQSLPVPAA